MPEEIALSLYENAIATDFDEISTREKFLKEILDHSDRITVKSPMGTDISLSVKGREAICETDRTRKVFQVPIGETYVAPIESSAEGRICAPIYIEDAPYTFEMIVKGGQAIELSCPSLSEEKLNEYKKYSGIPGERIGEFAFGTNPSIDPKIIMTGPSSEKALGTVHLALGHNVHFGGRHYSERHFDLVISSPSVYIDGKILMDDGHLLNPEAFR